MSRDRRKCGAPRGQRAAAGRIDVAYAAGLSGSRRVIRQSKGGARHDYDRDQNGRKPHEERNLAMLHV